RGRRARSRRTSARGPNWRAAPEAAMSVIVLRREGIEPSNDKWLYEGQGDPSLNGLSANVGSIYVQMDSNPPGDVWTKTGTGDTAWTVQLSLPSTTSPLTVDQLGALTGTAGTP